MTRQQWAIIILGALCIVLSAVLIYKIIFPSKAEINDIVQKQIVEIKEELKTISEEVLSKTQEAEKGGKEYAQEIASGSDSDFLNTVNDWSERMVEYANSTDRQ